MRIIGMDIHRSFAQVAVLENGEITRQLRVDLLHDPVTAFAQTLSREGDVAPEATSNSTAVKRLLLASPRYWPQGLTTALPSSIPHP